MIKARIFTFALSLLFLMSGIQNESTIFSLDPVTQEVNNEDKENENPSLKIIMIPLGALGDSTLIDYGDTEILIDAGGSSSKGSPKRITDTLDDYVTDNKLEMIIITHSDSDHLVSFYSKDGISDWLTNGQNTCDYLIDFDITQDESITTTEIPYIHYFFKNETLPSGSNNDEDETDLDPAELKMSYGNYENCRKRLVDDFKKIKHYFTASECTYSKRQNSKGETIEKEDLRPDAQEATDILYFDDKGNLSDSDKPSPDNLAVHFLYNYFYDHPIKLPDNKKVSEHVPKAAELNLISVCTLLEFDEQKFLFTGDLVEFDSGSNYKTIGGETKLLECNDDQKKILESGVLFFKAGHHGSMTSNSLKFLNAIRPQYVGINCVAANLENRKFPRDVAMYNFMMWTDKIYITEKRNDDGEAVPYHGEITFTYNSDKQDLDVTYTNNEVEDSIFDSQWAHDNIGFPYYIYNLSPGDGYAEAECTYIKIGHIDILVNCGAYLEHSKNLPIKPVFLQKIEKLCNDRVLDYVILSGSDQTNIFDLVGQSKKQNGLLYDNIYNTNYNNTNKCGYFKEITNLILSKKMFEYWSDSEPPYKGLKSALEQGKKTGFIKYDERDASDVKSKKESVLDNDYMKATLEFLNYSSSSTSYVDLWSIPFILAVGDGDKQTESRYLNLGRLTDDYNEFSSLLKSSDLKNSINIFTLPEFGRSSKKDGTGGLNLFLNRSLVNTSDEKFLLFGGNYGIEQKNSKYDCTGTYLYPSDFLTEGNFADIGYASCKDSGSNSSEEKEGDIRIRILIKPEKLGNETYGTDARFRVFSSHTDEHGYANLSSSTKPKVQKAFEYLSKKPSS